MCKLASIVDRSRRRTERRGSLTLNSIPLHAVLRGDLAKVILDNGSQGAVREMVMIDLGSEVQLSLGLELGV